jgi:dihydroorotate dehydrogenase (fumarate)
MVSSLLKNGPGHLTKVKDDMESWMERHEYESIDQMRGNMSLLKSPDPGAFERVNYMRVLQGGAKYV